MIPVTVNWVELVNAKKQIKSVTFIGFSENWVHPDFNPDGIRECFVNDDGKVTSARWSNDHDSYFTDWESMPSHFLDFKATPLKELF